MPSKLFADIGMNKKQAYGLHMFIYITPLLFIMQVPKISILDMDFENPLQIFYDRVFDDFDFLFGLILAITIDTFAGGIAALVNFKKDVDGNFIINNEGRKSRLFSSGTMFWKLSKKLIAITIAVLCVGILKNTVIDGSENIMSKWVDSGLYGVMLGFEGVSILRNSYKIYAWKPIKFIIDKLEANWEIKDT